MSRSDCPVGIRELSKSEWLNNSHKDGIVVELNQTEKLSSQTAKDVTQNSEEKFAPDVQKSQK